MASPDFSNYIDLTIYDLDPYTVYDDAVTYAQTSVPDFSLRTGTLEDALIQAVAYNTGLLSTQINRLPNGLMEGIAQLAGLVRLEGTFPTGTLTITVFDNNGVTVPIGTVFSYEVVSDDLVTSYPFETTADLVIPESSTSGSVAIKGLYAQKYPALLTGQDLTLVSPAPSVISAELAASLFIGTDTETDAEFLNRAAQHFAAMSSCLTTRIQMANYIKSTYVGIPYFSIFDLTASLTAYPAGDGLIYTADDIAGYVTVTACDALGEPLSTTEKNTLVADLENKCVAGLKISVENLDKVNIDVLCTIAVVTGYSAVEVRTSVDEYLTSRLSYVNYDFTGTILKNEIISQVANITGVKYVQDITFTSADPDFTYNSLTATASLAYKNNVPNASVEVVSI